MSVAAPKIIGEHMTAFINSKAAEDFFSESFSAARTYISLIDLEDIPQLSVNVLAWTYDEKRTARGSKALFVALNVEIAQQVAYDDLARCDALARLVEQMGGILQTAPLPEGVELILPNDEAPLYAPQFEPMMLAKDGLYFGVVSLRYKINRPLE